jgi:septum formation inhibitor-activating ATPase MinD
LSRRGPLDMINGLENRTIFSLAEQTTGDARLESAKVLAKLIESNDTHPDQFIKYRKMLIFLLVSELNYN